MIKKCGLILAMAAAAWMLATPLGMHEAVAKDAAKAAPEVIMFTTKTCGYCVRARAWFASRNVPWDERDIEASTEARAQWKAHGGVGTPLILINGKRFNGFSADALEVELARVR